MAITTQDRFFGEGIGAAGEADPVTAFKFQRQHLRRKRVEDALGVELKLSSVEVATKFEAIELAIKKADDQAFGDNTEFCDRYGITR